MKILDLLGNRNRLKILKGLSREPRYVTELSNILEVGRKAIIDHLSALEEYGLIEEFKKEGRRKYYRISENFVLNLILSKNNSLIYFEDLDINNESKEQVKREFKDIKKLDEKIKDERKNIRELFSLIREIETQLEKIHAAERYLGKRLDFIIEKSREEINDKTESKLEGEILKEILQNGQISPEEISKRLKIKRSKVFDTINNLRRKELI